MKNFSESLSTKLPIPIFDTAMGLNFAAIGAGFTGARNAEELLVLTSMSLFGFWIASSYNHYLNVEESKKIDFQKQYGADVKTLKKQPLDERIKEIKLLTEKVNDEYIPQDYPTQELAILVNNHLENYLEKITGERFETTSLVRKHSITQLIFPFGIGMCNFLDGEVYIFKNTGVFEPHVLAHEFAHRHGYGKELHAQVLAHFSLIESEEPIFIQSANCERLSRQLAVANNFSRKKAKEHIKKLFLRDELKPYFLAPTQKPGIYQTAVGLVMLPLYNLRMKLTGQNGIKDYNEGFTNFLYTIGDNVE